MDENTPLPPPRAKSRNKLVSKVTIQESNRVGGEPLESDLQGTPKRKMENALGRRGSTKSPARPPPPAKPPALHDTPIANVVSECVPVGSNAGETKKLVSIQNLSGDVQEQAKSPPKPRPRPRPQPRSLQRPVPKPRPREIRASKVCSMIRPTPAPRKDISKKGRSLSQGAVVPLIAEFSMEEGIKENDAFSEEPDGEYRGAEKKEDINQNVYTEFVKNITKDDEHIDDVSHTDDSVGVEPNFDGENESRSDIESKTGPLVVSSEEVKEQGDKITLCSADVLGSKIQWSGGEKIENEESKFLYSNGHCSQGSDNVIHLKKDDEIPPVDTVENKKPSNPLKLKNRSHSYENVPSFASENIQECENEKERKSWHGQPEKGTGEQFVYENVAISSKGKEANVSDFKIYDSPVCRCEETPSLVTDLYSNDSILKANSRQTHSTEIDVDGTYQDPGDYVWLEYRKDNELNSHQQIDTERSNCQNLVKEYKNEHSESPATYQVPSSPPNKANIEDYIMEKENTSSPNTPTKQRRPAPLPPTVGMREPLKARPWQQKTYSPSKGVDMAEVEKRNINQLENRKLQSDFVRSEEGSFNDSNEHHSRVDHTKITSSASSVYESPSGFSSKGAEQLQNIESSHTGGKRYSLFQAEDTPVYTNPRHSTSCYEFSYPRNSACFDSHTFAQDNSLDGFGVYIDMTNPDEPEKNLGEESTIYEDSKTGGVPVYDDDTAYLQPVDGARIPSHYPPARPPPPQFSCPDAEENFYDKIRSLKLGMKLPAQRSNRETEDDMSTDTDTDDEVTFPKADEGGNKLYLIAKEILTTERTFVAALKLLVEDFGESLKKIIVKDPRALPEGSFSHMFMNIEQIYSLDKKFLQELEARMRNWDGHRRIGDIIKEYSHFLKMYSSYIKGYDKAMMIFQENLVKFPKFSVLVREFERSPKCKDLKLSSYMLKPIQRIPSYRLLLIDYLKNLSKDSKDYEDIYGGLQIVSVVAEHINESMKEGEKFQEVLRVQSQIVNSNEIVKPGRFLVKEGMLLKLSRKESQGRMFFLFTDVLLYCSIFGHGQFKLIQELPLAGMSIFAPDGVDFVNEFTVVSTKRSFTLSASTPEERLMWIEALNGAIADVAKKLDTFAAKLEHEEITLQSTVNHEIGKVAPPWIPDDRVTMCQLCTVAFTVYNRRHHCRACGQVVCSHCSSYEAPLQYMDFEAARVCENCFKELLTTLEEGTRRGETEILTSLSKDDILSRFKDVRKKKRSKHGRKSLPSKFTEVRAQDVGSSNSGYMKIKRRKAWKKYWFVLKDHVLYTYKASSDPAALDTLPVLGYTLQQENWETEGFVFQLMHHGLKEPLVYKCESKVAAEMWVRCLKKAVDLDSL